MKKQNGMTLAGLIIATTIIPLLLGISISVAFNGGLFSTAKDASDKYETEYELLSPTDLLQ